VQAAWIVTIPGSEALDPENAIEFRAETREPGSSWEETRLVNDLRTIAAWVSG
jgi:hypothetical protein